MIPQKARKPLAWGTVAVGLVGGFEGEQERYRQRLTDAKRRLDSYRSREGSEFAFASELAEKRRQLAEIEEALAMDSEPAANPLAA